jgi:hypothetical protein
MVFFSLAYKCYTVFNFVRITLESLSLGEVGKFTDRL